MPTPDDDEVTEFLEADEPAPEPDRASGGGTGLAGEAAFLEFRSGRSGAGDGLRHRDCRVVGGEAG